VLGGLVYTIVNEMEFTYVHFSQDHVLAYDGDVEIMLQATFTMLQDRVYDIVEKALS
jgi:hypothetical protein